MNIEARRTAVGSAVQGTAVVVLAAISICHMLNDVIQSLIMAIYPMLKENLALDFGQIGLITFTFQFTASVLQPLVGYVTDRYPTPYSLVLGMSSSLIGVLLIAFASSYVAVLAAAALIGMGSSVFHPESSRVARLASGGRHGMAQSVFQVGGNMGSSLGPLLAAFFVVPRGQSSLAWCALIAIVAIGLLYKVGRWSARHRPPAAHRNTQAGWEPRPGLSRPRVIAALLVLAVLIFSKYFYLASLSSYYIFYLIAKFGVSTQVAQLHLFVFLGAVAVGTILGGPIGDRIGPKYVIWGSILGVAPFTLLLPHADLFWTTVLTVPIGLLLIICWPFAEDLLLGRELRIVRVHIFSNGFRLSHSLLLVLTDFSRDGLQLFQVARAGLF
jgi:FSR family fosmidomycin resistance protein-like MFS transporter